MSWALSWSWSALSMRERSSLPVALDLFPGDHLGDAAGGLDDDGGSLVEAVEGAAVDDAAVLELDRDAVVAVGDVGGGIDDGAGDDLGGCGRGPSL